MTLLTERYAPQIAGVLSCWDRILLFGTLAKICFAGGMTSYLYEGTKTFVAANPPVVAETAKKGMSETWKTLSPDTLDVFCSMAVDETIFVLDIGRSNPEGDERAGQGGGLMPGHTKEGYNR